MKKNLIASAFAFSALFSVSAIAGEELFGPFNLQSGHVTSNNTSGKSAHRTQCYEATNDRFFKDGSWNAEVISEHGKATSCQIHDVSKKELEVTSTDGTKFKTTVPNKFCVSAHAETGSGAQNIGKTAWIECNVTATLVEFKK